MSRHGHEHNFALDAPSPEPHCAGMEFHSAAHYAHELKPSLPAGIFAPARSRLLWLPVHLAVIAVATTALGADWLPWGLDLLLPLVIGASFAGLTFLGHETLHGAVVRQRALQRIVGWFGFLPFVISPTLWVAWHNRTHHPHANQPALDPDMYPTLAEYRTSLRARVATDHFALGRGRWRGVASLIVGFSIQSAKLLCTARQRDILSRRALLVAIAETLLGVAVWTTVAVLVGPAAFVLAFVAPLILANTIVMSFILTNHGLSPLTAVNDPLVNSLSVTTPRLIEWLTLGFGLHVEHHLFPAMSGRHAKALRAQIVARWPERYQAMPLGRALGELHRTSRIYADATTLVDPRTGQAWPALVPRALVVRPA